MLQHRRSLRWRTPIALLTVLLLIATLIPILPTQRAEADADITLSSTIFPAGYPGTRITLTGGNMFPFHPGAQISLYNESGQKVNAIADVQYLDSRHMSFTLQPGLIQGRYRLLVISYETAIAEIQVMSNSDPANVQITPGSDRDIRIDWIDPSAGDTQDIVVQYGPINLSYFPHTAYVPRGKQTLTLKGLDHNTNYRIKLLARKSDGTLTHGTEFTNGGAGYRASDTTPPGDLTNLLVSSIPNGFDLRWKDPIDPDLHLITVQYAEHGTSRWSDAFVVTKGIEHLALREMNTAKRYDFRFTKTDTLGNWSQQLETNNGYGYTYDTTPPSNVSSLSATVRSKSEVYLTWQDPTDANSSDFHHVKIYLKSALTDWISVGRAEKGVKQFTLTGLASNIEYSFRVVSVDNFGNESSGAITTRTLDTSSLAALRNVVISQDIDGGLKLQWSESGPVVDFSIFKVYYAQHGSTDYREATLSSKGTRSAYLRDLPRGTYDLQFRLYDRYGIEKDFYDEDNKGYGFYVAGKSGGNYPEEIRDVRIQPHNSQSMQISWNPASTDGTHVELYVAERSTTPQWRYLDRVDKRDLRYEVRNLSGERDYFFKLVVVDAVKNTSSYGIIYDNSGYGYNLFGGDRYPPKEVTNASATLSGNALQVTYFEPTDPDFEKAIIYAQKTGSTDGVLRFDVPRGQSGTTIRDLTPGATYTLRITTVDTFGNESKGISLNNNGLGYRIPETGGVARNEVRNALLIPETNKLTVRFQDPLFAEYSNALISIKKVGSSSYQSSKTVYKGANEATFDGLDANSFYQVRIVTLNSAGQASNGINLGGTTGIGLQPVSKVQKANVTEAKGSLIVTWQDPAGTLPTGVQVEVQARGTSTWSEPLIIQPGTGKAVIQGLGDTQSYKVRVTTLLNQVASADLVLENRGNGFRPDRAEVVAQPSQITFDDKLTQRISLVGTNTRFPYSKNEIGAKLYTADGQDVSSYLTDGNTYSSTRYDLTIKRSLPAGLYRVVLSTTADGEWSTWIKIVAAAPVVQAVALDLSSAVYGATPAVKVTGVGFKTGAKVVIDGMTEVTPYSLSSDQLTFTLPSGLLPGVHKLAVKTSDGTTSPLGFTIHPFSGTVTYNPPSSRTDLHQAELRIKNHDSNSRSSKVLVQIRKNGQLIETKEFKGTFSSYETISFKLDFGGVNSTYAEGPMSSLSLKVFVVDAYTNSPLAEPITFYRTLNL